jgi:hypothetical protein
MAPEPRRGRHRTLTVEIPLTDPYLRPLMKSDFAALVALWRGADAAAADRAAHALLVALQAERTVLVAELDDQPAGYVVVDLKAGAAEQPVVAPAGRAAGLDRCLAAAARDLIALDHGLPAPGFLPPPARVDLNAAI